MWRRIYWKQFITNHPELLRDIQRTLGRRRCRLVLKFDDAGVCKDAFIEKNSAKPLPFGATELRGLVETVVEDARRVL